MNELASLAEKAGWTWLLPTIVIVVLAKTVLDLLITSSEKVMEATGRYGQRVAARQAKRRTHDETLAALRDEVAGLKQQLAERPSPISEDLLTEVDLLAYQLSLVRWREEMVDAYLVDDADFHRDAAIAGIEGLPPHTPFREHERQWKETHPRPTPRRRDCEPR